MLFGTRQHLSANISVDDVYLTRIFWQQTYFLVTLVTTVTGFYTTRCILVVLFKRASFCERTYNNQGTQNNALQMKSLFQVLYLIASSKIC